MFGCGLRLIRGRSAFGGGGPATRAVCAARPRAGKSKNFALNMSVKFTARGVRKVTTGELYVKAWPIDPLRSLYDESFYRTTNWFVVRRIFHVSHLARSMLKKTRFFLCCGSKPCSRSRGCRSAAQRTAPPTARWRRRVLGGRGCGKRARGPPRTGRKRFPGIPFVVRRMDNNAFVVRRTRSSYDERVRRTKRVRRTTNKIKF